MDEEQRRRFTQFVRQFTNRGERCGGLPALFEDVVRQRLFVRQRLGFPKRNGCEPLAPQQAKGVVADDAAQPSRKGRGFGEIGQRRSELEAQLGQLRQELESSQKQLRSQQDGTGAEYAKLEARTKELQAAK